MIKFCSADYVFSVMHQSFETPRTPPTIIGGHPGQTGGFHLVFSWFRFSGSQGMHLFSQWLSVLYNAEAEWGFGRDFTCGSQAPLQDWVQVASCKLQLTKEIWCKSKLWLDFINMKIVPHKSSLECREVHSEIFSRALHCISQTVKVNSLGISQWWDAGVSNDWCIIVLCSVPCPFPCLHINITPTVFINVSYRMTHHLASG